MVRLRATHASMLHFRQILVIFPSSYLTQLLLLRYQLSGAL